MLATVGPDGRPQMTSVWFLAEDGRVRFSLNTNRQKTKNLQANPVIGVHIQDATNGGRYLEVRGDAASSPTTTTFRGPRLRQVRRRRPARDGRGPGTTIRGDGDLYASMRSTSSVG